MIFTRKVITVYLTGCVLGIVSVMGFLIWNAEETGSSAAVIRSVAQSSLAGATMTKEQADLLAELHFLKLSALQRRAAATAVSQDEVDRASDADDPRSSLTDLILSRHGSEHAVQSTTSRIELSPAVSDAPIAKEEEVASSQKPTASPSSSAPAQPSMELKDADTPQAHKADIDALLGRDSALNYTGPSKESMAKCVKWLNVYFSQNSDGHFNFLEYFEKKSKDFKGSKIHSHMRQLLEIPRVYKSFVDLELFSSFPNKPRRLMFVGSRNSAFWTLREQICDQVYGNVAELRFNKGDVVVDLGANLGIFAVLIALVHPQIKVIAYEASPVNALVAKENVRLNGLQNRVSIHNQAITADGSYVAITNCVHRDRKSAVGGSAANCGWRQGFAVKVGSVNFSTIIETMNLKRIRFFKMDCEGCECAVLPQITRLPITKAVGECHTLSHHKNIPQEEKVKCVTACNRLMDFGQYA
jgi:FkbM family methyltransferase